MNILRFDVPAAQCFHLVVSMDERRHILILGGKYCPQISQEQRKFESCRNLPDWWTFPVQEDIWQFTDG